MIKQQFDQDDHRDNSNKIEYIVIHDTGNTTDTAQANANYFCTGSRKASAHYFVDNIETIQIVRDQDSAYHCGDGYGRFGITNNNSIGIEMCRVNNKVTDKTINNTIDLVVILIKKYGVTIDKVVTHYMASRKNCPSSLNYNNWEGWKRFISLLQKKLEVKAVEVVHTSTQKEEDSDMFNDNEMISDWAKSAVDKMETLGLFKGDENGNINPQSNITREEFAVVIDRMLKLLGK